MRVRYLGISALLMALLSIFGMIAMTAAAPTATAVTAPKVNTPSPIATKTATAPAATSTTAAKVETTATVEAAATVTATVEAAATDAATAAGSPVAETATAVPVAVITLVLWYEQTPNGGPLKLSPIQINENGVAGASTDANAKLTGTVDFEDPDNNSLPRVKVGDSTLDGYAVTPDNPDTVLRWTYFNDDSGLRPSTLVVQVKASAGPYKNYEGTATFISRASKAGGVLVIALNPPAA